MKEARRNAFEVLGVAATATQREIEREGQRRLALLAAGLAEDAGPDAEHEIRWALAELRDPRRRLQHEVLAQNLGVENVVGTGLEAELSALEAALPRPEPTTSALAEEILWREVRWPSAPALPPDHEEERRRAFAPPALPAATLLEELDWRELVYFRPPTKAPRAARRGR